MIAFSGYAPHIASPAPKLPPGPRPAPVNTYKLMTRPLESLQGWRARYGDVFSAPMLVFGMGVYVSDPDAIRDMFTGDQSDLLAGEANSPLAPMLGDKSVLILDGPEHLRQRKLLLPPFGGSNVAGYRQVIRDVAEREVATWHDGRRIVMRERMRAVTFEVIVRLVFGVTEQARVERMRKALLAVVDTQLAPMMPERLRIEFGGRGPWGRFVAHRRAADALIYEEIARRREATDLEERDDVLSILLRARDEDGNAMTDVELRDELITMLLAGHETTATGLAFAFDLLPRDPAVLSRLRDELDSGDDSYLDAVVTETLRLRPVIDAAERTLTVPREFAGHLLPAGIRVYPAIALVQLRPDLYPEPQRFRPERFLEEGAQSYTWLPFGGGIRRCIGAALAQAEMAEVIRTVVSSVDIEPERPEREPVVIRGITLVPKHGTPVRIRTSRASRASRSRAAGTDTSGARDGSPVSPAPAP
jgi:cytochrome P450